MLLAWLTGLGRRCLLGLLLGVGFGLSLLASSLFVVDPQSVGALVGRVELLADVPQGSEVQAFIDQLRNRLLVELSHRELVRVALAHVVKLVADQLASHVDRHIGPFQHSDGRRAKGVVSVQAFFFDAELHKVASPRLADRISLFEVHVRPDPREDLFGQPEGFHVIQIVQQTQIDQDRVHRNEPLGSTGLDALGITVHVDRHRVQAVFQEKIVQKELGDFSATPTREQGDQRRPEMVSQLGCEGFGLEDFL